MSHFVPYDLSFAAKIDPGSDGAVWSEIWETSGPKMGRQHPLGTRFRRHGPIFGSLVSHISDQTAPSEPGSIFAAKLRP